MTTDPRRLRDEDAALAALLDSAALDEATEAETRALDARMSPLLAPPAAATGTAVAGAASSLKLTLLVATIVLAGGGGAYLWQPWRARSAESASSASPSASSPATPPTPSASPNAPPSASQSAPPSASPLAQPPALPNAPSASRVAPPSRSPNAPSFASLRGPTAATGNPPRSSPSTSSNAQVGAPRVTVDDATSIAATAAGSAPPDELALLMRARAELAESRGADALDTVAQHARSFPHSAFAPERDALRIEALAQSGRDEEARAALVQHVARYPSAPYRERLRRLLEDESAASETNSR
jgi:hypothetical protein